VQVVFHGQDAILQELAGRVKKHSEHTQKNKDSYKEVIA